MIELIVGLAQTVNMCWPVSGLLITIAKVRGDLENPIVRPFRWLWAELRPFYLPATGFLMGYVLVHGDMTPLQAVLWGMNVWSWFVFKDEDDDDRWKRRKDKLAAKIERRGSRLVAVPVGGES